MGTINKNLFDPVAYMLRAFKRKEMSALIESDQPYADDNLLEGYTLERDQDGLLRFVIGDEVFNYTLIYSDDMVLQEVVVENKVTSKVFSWQLIYEDGMLVRIQPSDVHDSTGVYPDYDPQDETDEDYGAGGSFTYLDGDL
ncbi:hypothetical protein GFC29_3808 (plasmid) [Anoxybacillus sp. B7M1]|uniref:hypothetical protein n=1 Tax=Anoxybacillus sp. B7M1 TaxID=1490057 RepID=UPI0005CC91E0|nr:hypothetical protein [Anoxybacillus sp. B7M1]ANB66163.1 hypothetical protein GFC29_3808 [Anoxybacillus sp. B7M1]